MGRLENILQNLQDVILVELSTLDKNRQYTLINDKDIEFIYIDHEYNNESYLIEELAFEEGWRVLVQYDYLLFTSLPIETQCGILDYIRENNEMD